MERHCKCGYFGNFENLCPYCQVFERIEADIQGEMTAHQS